MKFFNIFGLLISISIFISCDISENEDVDPTLSFVRIYDSEQFDQSFEPIDLIQTSDGGYLILGGFRRDDSDFLGVYLLRTDSAGNYVSDSYFPQEQVHPVGNILNMEGRYFFLSMDAIGLSVYLNEVSPDGSLIATTTLSQTYPLFVKQDGANQFILLSYNNVNKTTVLSALNMDGSIIKEQEFGIGSGEDIEEPIIEHFTRTGKQLPFFAGRADNGQYYFNGFYNFTLSIVFTNLNSGDPDGVIQGQQDKGGISGLMNLGGSQFSLARFNFGDNYVNANTELATTDITSSLDIEGNPMIEWENDALVGIEETQINNSEYILYASTTKGRQIVLQIYDRGTGNFITSEYLGFSNPYRFGSMRITEDEGLVILGQTQVAGRFPRLCLFKLGEDNLKKLVR